jgi:hypothetical protein
MADSEDGKGALGVAAIYPIHQPPGLRKPLLRPKGALLPEKARVDQTDQSAERKDYVENHPLVKNHAFKTTGNSALDALNLIKHQLAREAASLEFYRSTLEGKNQDTSTVSGRIVTAWAKVADLELKIKKEGVTVFDPKSPHVARVFTFWLDVIKEVMSDMAKEKVLTPEVMDLFFNKFSSAMEGWEDRIE